MKAIENAVEGRLSVAKAALLLQVSGRQVQRLKQRYRPDSADWVKHGNQGRSKPWALAGEIRERIIELAQNKYSGFNDTPLWEKLAAIEGLAVSRETVRRTLRQAKIASPQKRRAKKLPLAPRTPLLPRRNGLNRRQPP